MDSTSSLTLPFYKRLGVRLTILMVAFVVLLAVTTALLIAMGFSEAQRNATERSVRGLEDQGRASLAELVEREAQLIEAQLERAALISRTAAHYLEAMLAQRELPWQPVTLTQASEGQWFYGDAARLSDTWIRSGTDLDDEVWQDLRDTALLEPLMPTLLEQSGDAVAIYFVSPRNVVRYYPVMGLHNILAPSLDITVQPTFALAAPAQNPQGRTVWTPPYVDDAGHGLLVTASTPIYTGGAFRGVLGVDVSLARLAEQLGNIEPMPGSDTMLLDESGRILAASSGLWRLFGETPPQLTPMRLAPTGIAHPQFTELVSTIQSEGSGVTQLQMGGREVVLSFATLPSLGWQLVFTSPFEALVAPSETIALAIRRDAEDIIRSTTVIMMAFFLLALISATVFSRRFLTAPIEALATGTQEVAAGNLGVKIPVDANNELGLLASSFNTMTERLLKNIAQRQELEGQYQSIFEATSDGVIIRDLETFRVVEANPAYCKMHGCSREDIIGSDFRGADYQDYLKDIRERGEFRARASDVRADGTPFSVEVMGTIVSYQGKPHLLVTLRDITEQARAYELLEARVAERTLELSTLLDISESITMTLELAPLLDLILSRLKTILSYEGAAILTTEGEHHLKLQSYRGPIPQGKIERYWNLEEAEHSALVIRQREPVVIHDVRDDSPLAASFREVARKQLGGVPAYIGTWMGVPLIVRDRVMGLLAFDHSETGYYDPHRQALALAFANQAAVAIENAQLYEQAQGRAALEERQKLARELHDSVSQALYGISLGTKTAKAQLQRDPSRAAEPLDYVMSLAEAGIAEMRALIFELRPESLEQEGLVTALSKQATALKARYGLEVEVALGEPDLPLKVKEALYRVAQEALHNIVKHARASKVILSLETQGAQARLTVQDDGIGFDPGGSFPGHLGLTSMRERVANVGGSLAISSAPGQGTSLAVSIPVLAAAAS